MQRKEKKDKESRMIGIVKIERFVLDTTATTAAATTTT